MPRRGGYDECRWIDSLSAGYIRIGNRECYSRNEILSLRRTALARFDRFTPMMAVSSLDFSSHLRHKRPHECGRGTQECVRHALIRQAAFEAVAQTLAFAASALTHADAQPMRNGG